ncbi:MAG: 50S ribosomal protein L11 methyltransferase [Actinomycetes bacterium]
MLRLALRVRPEDAEVVLAELLEIAPSGVEEVEGDGWVEYAVYGAPGELPSLPDLEATAGGALVEVVTTEVDDDWAERWREFHKPLVLEGLLRVRPPWEPKGEEAHDIVVDPGRAFGTGAHPTTSLCLGLLLGLEPRGSLLDLGCGSGVLAILAARLGFAPVLAADNDLLAVEATAENALVNSVEMGVRRVDLRTDPVPEAETLVANILAPVLVELAGRIGSHRPERVILSGILDDQADRVLSAWQPLGYHETERVSNSGWTALGLTRP